jgi:rhodanese-related sulfurtransferase
MKGITAAEFSKLMSDNAAFQLIDVREPDEHRDFNIGGELIPLAQITQHIDEIETGKPVIFYCKKGIRSQIAIQRLHDKFPFKNLINLIGGTEAWKRFVSNAENV